MDFVLTCSGLTMVRSLDMAQESHGVRHRATDPPEGPGAREAPRETDPDREAHDQGVLVLAALALLPQIAMCLGDIRHAVDHAALAIDIAATVLEIVRVPGDAKEADPR